MIDIDDDINSDDIWVKFNEIWVIFGWYLGEIWDEIDDIINDWYWWWH